MFRYGWLYVSKNSPLKIAERLVEYKYKILTIP